MSQRPGGTLPPALARELASYIRSQVEQAVRGVGGRLEADPWVGHPTWVAMGLCPSLRAACSLARSGAIAGVCRIGNGRSTVYVARQSALDAWIQMHPVGAAAVESADEFELEMSKRKLVPNERRGRR